MKKYELVKECFVDMGKSMIFRIKALIDIEGTTVKKGNIGGYIQCEANLDHFGSCWVYGDSRVYGSAKVYGDASVSGNAWVFGEARVYGRARVFGNAWVYGNAKAYDSAWVYGNVEVLGNADVHGKAEVYNNARVYGKAIVSEKIKLLTGRTASDISNNSNPILVLRNSLDVAPTNKNKVILYKKVNKISKTKFKSLHDHSFIYELKKKAVAKDCDLSMSSCSSGLHASTPGYCNEGDTLIAVEIDIKDIITIQEGKVRCKALKVLYVVEYP